MYLRGLILFTTGILILLCASMAFAAGSNTSDITQNGGDNEAKVEQNSLDFFGPATNGLVTIIQTSPSGSVDGNFTSVFQAGGAIIGDTATVTQTGEDNRSIVSQLGEEHVATVTQEGEGNRVTVVQFGLNDEATIEQLENGGVSTGNIANVVQFTITGFPLGSSDGNEATIRQLNGDQNTANIVFQSGDQNTANILQENSQFSDATIDQSGDNNTLAEIKQEGFDNDGSISQIGSDNFLASIIQDGDENLADINQDADFNSATIVQTGDNNTGLIDQNSNSNGAVISSIGNNNTANVFQ